MKRIKHLFTALLLLLCSVAAEVRRAAGDSRGGTYRQKLVVL